MFYIGSNTNPNPSQGMTTVHLFGIDDVALAIAGAGAMSAFSGGGSSKVKYSEPPETDAAKEARARLLKLAGGEPPDVPRREIAPLPPMTKERGLARTTATELAQPQDIFSLPEVQGIILEATQKGDLLANRLGRMLQSAGALTSTPGRDVLGRAVTDVQKNLASSLAPFAAEERRRRAGLIPVLEALGLTEELRAMGFTQAELDALFQQETTESQQLQTFTIPLLQSIIGLQPGVQPIIQGQQPSLISQLAPIIGPALGGYLNRTPTPAPTLTGAANQASNVWLANSVR